MGGGKTPEYRQGHRWAGLGQKLTSLVLLLGLLVGLLWGDGAAAAPALPPLTADVLQQRLDNPVQREGRPTLDLRRFTVDLRPENGEFRDRFYRQVQQRLQRGSKALALDLSGSLIQGDLDLQRLSLREPLYGEALFPLLNPEEQAQLQRDRRRLSQLSQLSRSLLLQPQTSAQGLFLFRGPLNLTQTRLEGNLNGADIFFLGPLTAVGAQFTQGGQFTDSRFSQPLMLTASQWLGAAQFRNSLFFDRVRFSQSRFSRTVTFQGSEFYAAANFAQVQFGGETQFSRVQFQGNGDFAQTLWEGSGSFSGSTFGGDLFLTEARLGQAISFRQARFSHLVNLRGATVLQQLDFGDGVFVSGAYINVAALEFNADQAEILGSPGHIGRVLSVPSLAGNETLLRNLVRNFRQLEQVPDANYLEYTTERLRWGELRKRLTAVNVNTASAEQLTAVGFSPDQAAAVVAHRQEQMFLSPGDLLDLETVDLAAYVKVRDRIVAQPALSLAAKGALGLQWLGLGVLLCTSHYGTSIGLVFGVGLLAIAVSSLLFWGVDRYRRWRPTPILPPRAEVLWMGGSSAILLGLGGFTVIRLSDWFPLTLLTTALAVLPIPALLMGLIYRQGRFHNLLDSSYLLEDGGARQLRLLIARLPILPSFHFFRDRFVPIAWDRRRNWLNYYDFSLNNWFKFGFNDIRLRDQEVPGLITALVWYQWAVGLLYVALLLWTFSRTIPGLNLLLYF